uniref:substrate-binding periplasmic protein n=1 Tax=Cellvibrio fontiphilus TaxID=1815559 RepID=UPI002B4BE872|nr:transporter substrate-binding domain-containing protein [Cellvibrio fontiphilus]
MKLVFREFVVLRIALACFTALSIAYLMGYHPTASASSSAPAVNPVRIATGEFAPWTGKDLPHSGHVNHIIASAFAAEGIEVEFVYLPWKRAFEETRLGKFDATSYWYENSERREAMLFSDPLVVNRTVFFQRANAPAIKWQNFSDLSGYRMSATLGFTYTEAFYRAIEAQTINPIMVPSDIQNIKLLLAERVDLFATDEMSGFYMAAQLSIDPRKLRVIEPALNSPEGYLLTSKIHPNAQWLIQTFNSGLKKIKANGSYRKILDRVDNSSFYNPRVSSK